MDITGKKKPCDPLSPCYQRPTKTLDSTTQLHARSNLQMPIILLSPTSLGCGRKTDNTSGKMCKLFTDSTRIELGMLKLIGSSHTSCDILYLCEGEEVIFFKYTDPERA